MPPGFPTVLNILLEKQIDLVLYLNCHTCSLWQFKNHSCSICNVHTRTEAFWLSTSVVSVLVHISLNFRYRAKHLYHQKFLHKVNISIRNQLEPGTQYDAERKQLVFTAAVTSAHNPAHKMLVCSWKLKLPLAYVNYFKTKFVLNFSQMLKYPMPASSANTDVMSFIIITGNCIFLSPDCWGMGKT